MKASASATAAIAPRRKPRIRKMTAAPTAQPQKVFTSFPNTYVTMRTIGRADITIRSIRPDDEPLLFEFHNTLSDYSVHFRFFGAISLRQRTIHERLRRHCVLDHTREFALVADYAESNGHHQILGVGRLFREPGCDKAEFALLISDQWQRKGLGTVLLKLLVRLGRQSHLRRIIGHILADNTAMRRVSEKVGFKLHMHADADEWLAEIDL
jgi:acetyltransferase